MDQTLKFGSREWNLAYRVALRILKAPDQAEDAAQEAILRAYKARDKFEGRSRFESWLHRIAFTTAVGFLRSPYYKRRHTPANGNDPLGALAELPTSDYSPEDNAKASQLAQSLEGCLSNMGEKDRVAFTERFLHGTSERDLGKLLGVSTNAAKQRAFRARRTIRRCLADKHAPATAS